MWMSLGCTSKEFTAHLFSQSRWIGQVKVLSCADQEDRMDFSRVPIGLIPILKRFMFRWKRTCLIQGKWLSSLNHTVVRRRQIFPLVPSFCLLMRFTAFNNFKNSNEPPMAFIRTILDEIEIIFALVRDVNDNIALFSLRRKFILSTEGCDGWKFRLKIGFSAAWAIDKGREMILFPRFAPSSSKRKWLIGI